MNPYDLTRQQYLNELRELVEWLSNRPDPRGAALVVRAYEEITSSQVEGCREPADA